MINAPNAGVHHMVTVRYRATEDRIDSLKSNISDNFKSSVIDGTSLSTVVDHDGLPSGEIAGDGNKFISVRLDVADYSSEKLCAIEKLADEIRIKIGIEFVGIDMAINPIGGISFDDAIDTRGGENQAIADDMPVVGVR